MPIKASKNFLASTLRVPLRAGETEIRLLSASLAFSTLLSLVPFLAVGFAVLHAIAGFEGLADNLQTQILSFFQFAAGNDASLNMRKVLQRLSQRSWTVTSAAVLFITSLKLFIDLELAVNRLWMTPQKRRWWDRWFVVLGIYFLIPFGLAVYAGLRSVGILQPVISWNPSFWDAAVTFSALFLMNRWLPHTKVQWFYAALGAALSTVGLAILGSSFKWLTKKVFIYSKIYGSLAAIPLLCLFILITWQIILVGVAFTADLHGAKRPKA